MSAPGWPMPLSPKRQGMATTAGLNERLVTDRALLRICGFPLGKKPPSESTLLRAFEEFAVGKLAERVHEALVTEHRGDELVGHLSRDGTAIEARERPRRVVVPDPPDSATDLDMPDVSIEPIETPEPAKRKRGRSRNGDNRPAAKEPPLALQRKQALAQVIADLPTACDRGTYGRAFSAGMSYRSHSMIRFPLPSADQSMAESGPKLSSFICSIMDSCLWALFQAIIGL